MVEQLSEETTQPSAIGKVSESKTSTSPEPMIEKFPELYLNSSLYYTSRGLLRGDSRVARSERSKGSEVHKDQKII
jgi:hypothetical protein